MRYLALALVMIASPAAAADQFDLVCTSGKSVTRYRVDLAKNEACEGACDRVWKMGPSSTGELRLIERVPAFRGDLEERLSVNRVTGEYRYRNQLGDHSPAHREGRCEPSEFSGFPPAKF